MRYRPIIHKNPAIFHWFGKITFSLSSIVFGGKRTSVIKQKVKLFLKEIPDKVVTSNTERIIFERLQNNMDVVFDVGIQNELSYFRIKKDCEYHLFEPNKKFIKLLKKQIASFDNHNIRLNEFGLSDGKQSNCVYYEESESFEINPAYEKSEVDTGIRYSLETLDQYVKENNIPHIDLLKIDTEGYDYKIIMGGLNTIKADRVSYIQFEYWKGVKRFVDVLEGNFHMYLMMEPRLLKFIQEKMLPIMTPEQNALDWNKSLQILDKDMIDFIDNKLSPTGAGGNVFCINKKLATNIQDLIFDIKH